MNPPRKGKKVVVLDIVSVVCRCERPHVAVSHFAARLWLLHGPSQ